MADASEVERLRAIGVWMREVGAVELELGDLRIRLGPKLREVDPTKRVDADARSVLSEEERAASAEDDEEAEHKRFWSRLTRSSGAPIPAFKRRSA